MKKEDQEPIDLSDPLAEFEKSLAALRNKIEQEIRAEQGHGIKGYGIMNEAKTEWAIRHIPASAQEREQMRAAQQYAKAAKEKKISDELNRRLADVQPKLEVLYFGQGGLDAWHQQQHREQQIEAFTKRQAQRRENDQKAALEKQQKKQQMKTVFARQTDTHPKTQDNRPYLSKTAMSSQPDFKASANQQKTTKDVFNEQNREVRHRQAVEALRRQKKKELAQKNSQAYIRKRLEANSRSITDKQPQELKEQDNKYTEPLTKVFQRPALPDEQSSKGKPVDRDSAEMKSFKTRLDQDHEQEKTITIKH